MNMLIKTYRHLLVDIVDHTGIHLDAPDDLTLSWVLSEAPKLDKQLLMWLEDGELEQPSFPDWLLPLWEAFLEKFDEGILKSLRQLLVFCYKAEFESSIEQDEVALRGFIDTDLSIDTWNEYFKSHLQDPLFREARRLVGLVIHKANWSEISPSHGPGAVFPPRKPCFKSDFNTIYDSIQNLYPFDQFFHGLPSFWWENLVDKDHKIQTSDKIVCHLTAVPKDSRGPRLIAVHPAEAIWIQQGQRRILERCITNNPLTRHCINFDDQSINGNIALVSSKTKGFVTLDLKEASDRLSNVLVHYLFGDAHRFFDASRAGYVTGLRIDGVHELRKFAPMGNCLTFPVQSLVFWALVRSGIRCHYGFDCNDIYVFGDDIVYPSKYHTGALNALIRAGLVPNMSKTFRLGSFRESCGVDAFNGINITPYRMKAPSITSYSDAVSFCDLAKRLRLGGFHHCSSYIYSKVRAFMGKLHLSNNPLTQGIFEYVSTREFLLYEKSHRFNDDLQRWESRVALLKPAKASLSSHDWYHVQDSLLRISREGGWFSERQTEYPVPYRYRLTYGWTASNLC